MANPQLENGFTRVSNELLEALMRAPVSLTDLRCLLAVARETYGWQRKARALTAYRLSNLTGVQRTKVARAMKRLVERNILANGSGGVGLQKDYEAWQAKRGSKLYRVRIGPGSRTDSPIGSKSDPLKTMKKENKRAEASASSPHRAVVEEYVRLFQAKFGTKPDIVGGRDGTIIRDLLKSHDFEEVLELLRGFFRVGTRWNREKGRYDLGAFKSVYNDLLVMRRNGEL